MEIMENQTVFCHCIYAVKKIPPQQIPLEINLEFDELFQWSSFDCKANKIIPYFPV